jgi:hypothetical protein
MPDSNRRPACIVVDLPDDQLRPSAADGQTTNEKRTYPSSAMGGSAIGTQPIGGGVTVSGDIQLEDATVSGSSDPASYDDQSDVASDTGSTNNDVQAFPDVATASVEALEPQQVAVDPRRSSPVRC